MWCYVYWIDDDCAPLRLHQFFHKISTLDAPSSKICADIGGAELIFTQRMRKLQLHDDLRAYDGLGHGKVYQGPSTTPNRHLCTVGFYSQLICMNAAGDVVQLVIAKQCDFSRETVISRSHTYLCLHLISLTAVLSVGLSVTLVIHT